MPRLCFILCFILFFIMRCFIFQIMFYFTFVFKVSNSLGAFIYDSLLYIYALTKLCFNIKHNLHISGNQSMETVNINRRTKVNNDCGAVGAV